MLFSPNTIQANAAEFAERWNRVKGGKSNDQDFVRDFLVILGIENIADVGENTDEQLMDCALIFQGMMNRKRSRQFVFTTGIMQVQSAKSKVQSGFFHSAL